MPFQDVEESPIIDSNIFNDDVTGSRRNLVEDELGK